MKEIIKVVMLCQYWSDEMAEIVGRKHYFRELSPWIQETINLFKNKKDVELHIVAPNYASNTDVDFVKEGIIYHYFKYAPPFLSFLCYGFVRLLLKHKEPHKIAERLANLLTEYSYPKRRIPLIIKRIGPDIIHLYGSENCDYSVGVLPFLNNTPVLLTIQGYSYLSANTQNRLVQKNNQLRAKYERIINESVRYVTNYGLDYGFEPFEHGQTKYVLSAITRIPKVDASLTDKKYDIVFYANVHPEKGVEDLLRALGILKKTGRSLKTIIIGKAEDNFLIKLKKIILEESLENDVEITGFLDSHDEVYRIAASSRILVFPSHNDVSPNTIREAMFMKLPIVTYSIGGIPYFNVRKECLCLVDALNINKLAGSIIRVMDNADYREELIKNAYDEAINYYAPEKIYAQSISIYNDIINKENEACNLNGHD